MGGAPRGRWTPEMIDDLKDLLGTYKAEHIAQRLNRKYGTSFNARSVYDRCRLLGLLAQRNTGLYSFWLAAQELKVGRVAIQRWCERLGVKTIKAHGGYHRYVSEEGMAKLREVLSPPKEPSIKLEQAAKALAYTSSALSRQVKEGAIRFHRQGRTVFIPVAEVDRILRERRVGASASSGRRRQGRSTEPA